MFFKVRSHEERKINVEERKYSFTEVLTLFNNKENYLYRLEKLVNLLKSTNVTN